MVFAELFALASNPEARYYEAAPPSMGILWALLLDVLALAAFILLCFRLRRSAARSLRVIGTAIIVFFCFFAAFQISRAGADYFGARFSYKYLDYLKVALAAGFAVLFLIRRPAALRLAEGALLIMSPLFPITAFNAIQAYSSVNRHPFGKGSAAGFLPSNPHRNRVIWVVFDELDYRFAFDDRPARIHLDQFDALRSQSIFATHAVPPNPDTMPSLPSLILGRRVGPNQPDTQSLRYQTTDCPQWKDLVTSPHVFARARAAGFDTGVSGWDHPYCRILGKSLSDCAWDITQSPYLVAEKALNSRGFLAKALYIAEWQAQSFPLRRIFGIVTEPGGAAAIRQHSIDTFRTVLENGERMLCDQRLNLVLVHMPIPHPPGIWDASRGAFSTGNVNYIDNLQLANYTLGQLRKVLEQNGDWDKSTVLVSSDHPYRVELWYEVAFLRTEEMARLTRIGQGTLIPFLLKLPYQKSEVTYAKPFNSVLSSALLLDVLEGKVTTVEQAVSWLNTHADASLITGSQNCK